jgi:predicted nucleotidyltransferase
MLTPADIDSIVARIVARIDPERVIVFGSYAKGAPTITSDLDILVIKETDAPMAHRADDMRPLLGTSVVRIDVHVYTPEEVVAYAGDPLSFLHSVLTTGRTVFDRSTGALW